MNKERRISIVVGRIVKIHFEAGNRNIGRGLSTKDFSIHVNLENFRMINDPYRNITQHEMEIYRLSNLLINGGAHDWRDSSDHR